jgi:hypothetical protein
MHEERAEAQRERHQPERPEQEHRHPERGVAPREPHAHEDREYLRVLVEGHDQEHGGDKVNLRVPFTLTRAGVRLAALLPAVAHGAINRALRENDVDIDISPRPFDNGAVLRISPVAV